MTGNAKALSPKATLMVGATLFSMFFGAGNLILPPLLGVQAGTATLPATIGFFITGVGLPVLGIVAVALAGTVRELADRVHPVFSRVFVAAVYLAIGPCLAIPRTSSTAFEMLAPLLPAGISVEVVRLVFSVAFFALSFALAMHPGRLTRLLGRVTGPALILLIVGVVVPSLVSLATGQVQAAPAPVAPYDTNAAVQGFLTGYQTMDLLASLTFGLVIATNIRNLGVTDTGGVMREVCRAGVIAGVLMMAIYGGLAVVGFDLSAALAGATNGAEVITASATMHYGTLGTAVVAAIFLLACLNVCTGSSAAAAPILPRSCPACPTASGRLALQRFRASSPTLARCHSCLFRSAPKRPLPCGDCPRHRRHGAPRARRLPAHVARDRWACGRLVRCGEPARRLCARRLGHLRCPAVCRYGARLGFARRCGNSARRLPVCARQDAEEIRRARWPPGSLVGNTCAARSG